MSIQYKEGYKYQLVKNHIFDLGQRINDSPLEQSGQDSNGKWYWEVNPLLRLYPDGSVYLGVGYAWDGCSGPAIDDKTNQVPGLEHDAVYQLIRNGVLPEVPYRKLADERLRKGCTDRGMNWFRAWYFYMAVRFAGHKSATIKKNVRTAE